LDRTQEVAGSNPASSIRRSPANESPQLAGFVPRWPFVIFRSDYRGGGVARTRRIPNPLEFALISASASAGAAVERRLGDVVSFRSRPRGLEVPDPVPFLSMKLVPERGDRLDTFEQRPAQAARGGTYFEEGDFLLARISPSFENGKQGIVRDVPGGWGVGSTELFVMHSDRLSASYLSFLFRSGSVRDLLQRRMEGATGRLRVPRGAIEDLTVALPPSEVQELVARDLDALFDRIERGRGSLLEAVATIDQYERSLRVAAMTGHLANTGDGDAKALLEEIRDTRQAAGMAIGVETRPPTAPQRPFPFRLPRGWTWASADELALRVQYGTSSKAGGDAGGVPVVRMGNIVKGTLRWSGLKYLPQRPGELEGLLLAPGDILFNRTNSLELVGKSALVEDLEGPVAFASYLIRLTLHPAVEPAWLNHWLNSPYARGWARREAVQQVGQANISGGKLRAMPVPLPPTAVQREICRALDEGFAETERLRAHLTAAAAEADVLQQALLSHYLTPGSARGQSRHPDQRPQPVHA
jgi:type I restriction enzyme, S subunit